MVWSRSESLFLCLGDTPRRRQAQPLNLRPKRTNSSVLCASSERFGQEGVLLESAMPPRGYTAAFLPGIGHEHRDFARNMDHLAFIGAVVRDTATTWRDDEHSEFKDPVRAVSHAT